MNKKNKLIKFVKNKILVPLGKALVTVLKPVAILASFSFALGRAYERVIAINKGGYGYSYRH